MNYAEYWLLDAAIRLKLPFHWLSASNLGEMLNRPTHNLVGKELLQTLMRLFERGDLFLQLASSEEKVDQVLAPSSEFVQETLYLTHDEWIAGPRRISYGVTQQGAAKWEQLSSPQWEKFFEDGYCLDPWVGEIIAPSRLAVEEFFAMTQYDPWIASVIADSVQWTVVTPWQATYWKTLAVGYHLQFTYVPVTETEEHPMANRAKWFGKWDRKRRQWYTSSIGHSCS